MASSVLSKVIVFLYVFKQFYINKHKLLHWEELTWINFTSNKMSIKNGTSFICPYYLQNSLFSYGRILLRLPVYFHKHGIQWNYRRSLQNIKSGECSHRILSNQTYTTIPCEIDLRCDEVNLLVYGPDRPYFKQKQKNTTIKFWSNAFF